MASAERLAGELVQYETPDWRPLLNVAAELVDDFMWMHEVELEDGVRIHAYKHYWTRRYLHLHHSGRSFVYVFRELDLAKSWYEEVDLAWLLDLALSVWWEELDASPDQEAACRRVIDRATR